MGDSKIDPNLIWYCRYLFQVTTNLAPLSHMWTVSLSVLVQSGIPPGAGALDFMPLGKETYSDHMPSSSVVLPKHPREPSPCLCVLKAGEKEVQNCVIKRRLWL